MHILQDREWILTVPHLINQPRLKIVSKTVGSVMLLKLLTALISVDATFLLFGNPKTKVRGEKFEVLEEWLEKIEKRLGLITPKQMERVDGHWIERMDQVIRTNGDYIDGRFLGYPFDL
jgi:hypothetical protein